MSTSLLYHAFGIRGYQYARTDYQGGQVDLHHPPGARDLPLLGLRLATRSVRAARSSAASAPCPSAAGPPSSSCPSRASSAGPAASCARSRSPSPTRGGATPGPSSGTPWNCPGG